MKVTFCTFDDVHGLGGPNSWLRRLLPELQKRGIQPKVLVLTLGPGPHPTVDGIRQMGIDCAVAPCPEYTEQRVKWLLTQLAQDPPDVFVPNLGAGAHFAARWVRESGIPTIGVLHSDDKNHRGIISEFVHQVPPFQLSGVACCSQYLTQIAKKEAKSGIIAEWLPYGAPVPATAVQYPSDRLRLIYAGRLVEEQKQISLTTKALCQAIRLVPNTEAVIYGDGHARPSVETILNEEGRDLPVTLQGRVDSEKVQQELLAGHVFVLLSDYEGLPVALMEAMACGVVPICLEMRSGIPELVEDDVTGLIVRDRDADFVRAVRRLREEPGLWQKLSLACRAKIEKDYSNTVCADRWSEFLKQMASQTGERKPITLPEAFDLPSLNPDLAHEDKRQPPIYKHAYRQVYRRLRSVAGGVKRRLTAGR